MIAFKTVFTVAILSLAGCSSGPAPAQDCGEIRTCFSMTYALDPGSDSACPTSHAEVIDYSYLGGTSSLDANCVYDNYGSSRDHVVYTFSPAGIDGKYFHGQVNGSWCLYHVEGLRTACPL